MAYSPKQYRAIAWWANQVNGKPQIGAYPMVRMLMPDGTHEERNILGLVMSMDKEKKEKAKYKKERVL